MCLATYPNIKNEQKSTRKTEDTMLMANQFLVDEEKWWKCFGGSLCASCLTSLAPYGYDDSAALFSSIRNLKIRQGWRHEDQSAITRYNVEKCIWSYREERGRVVDVERLCRSEEGGRGEGENLVTRGIALGWVGLGLGQLKRIGVGLEC